MVFKAPPRGQVPASEPGCQAWLPRSTTASARTRKEEIEGEIRGECTDEAGVVLAETAQARLHGHSPVLGTQLARDVAQALRLQCTTWWLSSE